MSFLNRQHNIRLVVLIVILVVSTHMLLVARVSTSTINLFTEFFPDFNNSEAASFPDNSVYFERSIPLRFAVAKNLINFDDINSDIRKGNYR